MKRLFAVAVIFTSLGLNLWFCFRSGSPTVLASDGGGGGSACSSKNGDVNADGNVDLSDAVTILGNLFLGTPPKLASLCASAAPGGLPDTGQTNIFGGCRGQDADFATGCPSEGRFLDNGDSTVTDNCTGLQWQKDVADLNGDGFSTAEDFAVWCDALVYCDKLILSGRDDWRMPNVRELESIVDYGRLAPAIDPVFTGQAGVYWSSTSYTGDPNIVWTVYFYFGVTSHDVPKDNGNYVRAVRNAP